MTSGEPRDRRETGFGAWCSRVDDHPEKWENRQNQISKDKAVPEITNQGHKHAPAMAGYSLPHLTRLVENMSVTLGGEWESQRNTDTHTETSQLVQDHMLLNSSSLHRDYCARVPSAPEPVPLTPFHINR